MTTLTATKARSELFHLIRDSVRSHRSYRISWRAGNAVLLSEADYEDLLETLELLSTPGLVKSIRQAKQDIQRGRVYSLEAVFGAC